MRFPVLPAAQSIPSSWSPSEGWAVRYQSQVKYRGVYIFLKINFRGFSAEIRKIDDFFVKISKGVGEKKKNFSPQFIKNLISEKYKHCFVIVFDIFIASQS